MMPRTNPNEVYHDFFAFISHRDVYEVMSIITPIVLPHSFLFKATKGTEIDRSTT